jgi:thiamine-phosphate pyrophosphorylase
MPPSHLHQSLANASLYGIVDLDYVAPANATTIAAQLLEGGVGILQLRAKSCPLPTIRKVAQALQPLASMAGIPLIINDHLDIAIDLQIPGLHLGQDDGDLATARRAFAAAGVPDPIIGRSTHSPAQAAAGHAEGADYIGFGPLFPTPTKPGRPAIGLSQIADVHRLLPPSFPIFCIGGINPDTLPNVIAHGATRAVVVSALLLHPNPAALAHQLLKTIRPSETGR